MIEHHILARHTIAYLPLLGIVAALLPKRRAAAVPTQHSRLHIDFV
jgi:hypothetical protein